MTAATERLALRIEDRQNLDSARAEVQGAKNTLAKARLQLERSTIYAPCDGTIMRLYSAPGSMLSSDMVDGMLIATMYDPHKLQVRADVPLAEAARVKPGLEAEIKVEAISGKVFQGELINIVPEFDLQKNTLPVKVRIDNPDIALRPEMISRVEFLQTSVSLPADQNTLDSKPRNPTLLHYRIPKSALINGETNTLFVVGPDSRASRRIVTVSANQSNEHITVTHGLQISDKVILNPSNRLRENTKVTFEKVITDATY